ncbi:MAG: hypothetical protein Q9186_006641 [Xanthomendoza sp. 1 TL-2023]
MVNSVQGLGIESWTLYPVGILLIAARILSRRILLGAFKKLQIDDWLMLFVAPGVAEKFTPEEHNNAIFGSKFVMILEEFMLANTWLCKACLLILYHQMTLGLKQNRLVKIVGAYCFFGYVLVQILYLGVWCRPIQQYWQVPVDNSQCASYYHHLITSAVFNITSDLLMIYIPLPILIKARLPTKRKIVLCGVFSLGALVILSAILNRYYNFTEPYGSLVYLNWYVGEAATSVFVANVPHLWPLLSRIFALGAFNSLRRTSGNSSGNGASSGKGFYGKGSSTHRSNRPRPYDQHGYIRSESEERIANRGAGTGTWPLSESKTEATIEMGPLDNKGTGYMATAAGGENGLTKAKQEEQVGIVKTVQIRQYSNEV